MRLMQLYENISRRSFLGMLAQAAAVAITKPIMPLQQLFGGVSGVAAGGVGDALIRAVGGNGCETLLRFKSGMSVIDHTACDGSLYGVSSEYFIRMPNGVLLKSFELSNYPGISELAFPASITTPTGSIDIAEHFSNLEHTLNTAMKANDIAKIAAVQSEINAALATGVRLPALKILHSFQMPSTAPYGPPRVMVGDYTESMVFGGNSEFDYTVEDLRAIFNIYYPNGTEIEFKEYLKQHEANVKAQNKINKHLEKKNKTKYCKKCAKTGISWRTANPYDMYADIEFIDDDDYDSEFPHNHPSGIAYESRL